MHKRIAIQNYLKMGWQKKDIAEEIGCHRNTVSRIAKENPIKEKMLYSEKKHPLNEYKGFIEELLNKRLSLVRIHEELIREKNYDRSYDSLRRYIRNEKLKPVKTYIVLHTKPGEESQVDFGYVGLTPDNTEKMRKTWIFAMSLSFSRRSFHKTVYDQKVSTFIDCFIEAFEYFNGIPERVKIDNLKAAVLKANFYEPEYQKEFKQFADYYGFIIDPCKVRQPQEKGKVESGIKYVKNNFFKGRSFKSKSDMEYQLHQWQENVCNKRIHGTTKKIPEIVFQETEKNKLKALPDKRWECYRIEKRKVSTTCHIVTDNNYYSVPYKYINEIVEIRIYKNIIKIFFKNQEIAVHQRLFSKGEYQTNKSHYPEHKALSQTEYQFKQAKKMEEIGKNASSYFYKLIELHPQHWGRLTRGIINLTKYHGNEAIDLACKRAITFEVYSYRVISNICKKGLFRENEGNEKQKEPIKNSALARPLTYYSDLFISLILFIWNTLITLYVL